jgi:hypothetical protein
LGSEEGSRRWDEDKERREEGEHRDQLRGELVEASRQILILPAPQHYRIAISFKGGAELW